MNTQNPKLGGRLRHFLPFWKSICKDNEVIRLIKGVQFEFIEQPKQTSFPKPIVMSKEECVFMQTKLQELITDGSISKIKTLPQSGWLSNVFLVPKKDGGFRMILNIKPLNKFIKYRKFKMDHIKQVLTLIHPNMVLASLDISSAFNHIFVAVPHQKFLCFEWDGRMYQINCLPQGATCSPRIFVRVTTPLMKFLQRRGVTIMIYIDDTLLIARTVEELKRNINLTIETLQRAGFVLNFKKSHLSPTTRIEFLGFIIDTVAYTISLTEKKFDSLLNHVTTALHLRRISIRYLSKVIGKIVAIFPCCVKAPLHY